MFDIKQSDIITQEFLIDYLPDYFKGAQANVQSIANNRVDYLAESGTDSLVFSFHLNDNEIDNAIYLYRDGLVEDFEGCEFMRVAVISHPKSDCMKEILKKGTPKKHAVHIRYYINPHSGAVAYQHGLCLNSELIYQFGHDPCIPYYHEIKVETELAVFAKNSAREAVGATILGDFHDFVPTYRSDVNRIAKPFYHFPVDSAVDGVYSWLKDELGIVVESTAA